MAENLTAFRERRQGRRLLVFLLLIDLAFVIMHVLHKLTQHFTNSLSGAGMEGKYAAFYQQLNVEPLHQLTPYLANSLFNIEMDNGYAEIYQQLKFVGVILVLSYLCFGRRLWSFFPWALLFTYFLLDDSLRLHERLGSVVASQLSITSIFGLNRQDLGELSVTLTAGLLVLPLLLLAYYLGRPAIRRIFHRLALLLCLLVLFGVGADMVHSRFMHHPILSPLLALVEDGGEMLTVSLFMWYVFSLTKRASCAKEQEQSAKVGLPVLREANV